MGGGYSYGSVLKSCVVSNNLRTGYNANGGGVALVGGTLRNSRVAGNSAVALEYAPGGGGDGSGKHEVDLVLAAPLKIGPEQIAHRTGIIPLARTPPCAAGSDEPVGGRNQEPPRPVSKVGLIRCRANPETLPVLVNRTVCGTLLPPERNSAVHDKRWHMRV